MQQATIEVRPNHNVRHSTVEETIRHILNNFKAEYSGWIGSGSDAYVVFWVVPDEYDAVIEELTHRAFILI